MKKVVLIGGVLIVFLTTGSAFAFKCGTNLVKTGDKTFEVIKKCGEPISKEVVGYRLTKDKNVEFEIKEWVYEHKGGRHYFLTFHGTTLVNIESRKID
jgi:hypothetical protein